MEWFRVYSEMLTDPKLDDFTDAQIGIWIKLLCLANQQTQRGYIEIKTTKKSAMYALASNLRTRIDRLRTALELFSDRKMVTYDLDGKEGWVQITNWDKRQFQSDSSTPRVRKHREKKRFSNVQSRTEHRRNVSLNETVAPPVYDGSDLERATQRATPSQSPDEIQHSQSHAEKKEATCSEDGESSCFSLDEIFSIANEVSEKHDYPEIVDDVFGALAEGTILIDLWFCLYQVLNFYDQKKAATPRIAFRIELASRTKASKNY